MVVGGTRRVAPPEVGVEEFSGRVFDSAGTWCFLDVPGRLEDEVLAAGDVVLRRTKFTNSMLTSRGVEVILPDDAMRSVIGAASSPLVQCWGPKATSRTST